MIKSKIVLLSALVSCALISGCKEENKNNVSIEFMHFFGGAGAPGRHQQIDCPF